MVYKLPTTKWKYGHTFKQDYQININIVLIHFILNAGEIHEQMTQEKVNEALSIRCEVIKDKSPIAVRISRAVQGNVHIQFPGYQNILGLPVWSIFHYAYEPITSGERDCTWEPATHDGHVYPLHEWEGKSRYACTYIRTTSYRAHESRRCTRPDNSVRGNYWQ